MRFGENLEVIFGSTKKTHLVIRTTSVRGIQAIFELLQFVRLCIG